MKRRGFLKALSVGAITTPTFTKDCANDSKWHSGIIERRVLSYKQRRQEFSGLYEYLYTLGERFGRACSSVGCQEDNRVIKAYSFALTDINGNGIVIFSSDAIAAKKVILDDFQPCSDRSITAIMRKQKRKELPVKYMIDDRFVIHVRFKDK